jgi:selenide, water dikinase
LSEIFRGGLQALAEAGVALMGGHTVQDQEIKFGYAVTGEVDPARMWTNSGAKPGDRLILTKPIGTGVVATAIKFGRADQAVAARAIATMVELNRAAAEALAALPDGSVHGCTDITGFGLAGHASEMALASGCVLEIDVESVPILDGALELVDRNTPGGGRTNHGHFSDGVDASRPDADSRRIQLLYDPQTSGGLLVSVAAAAYDVAMEALRGAGVSAHPVGRVTERIGAGSAEPGKSAAILAVVLR